MFYFTTEQIRSYRFVLPKGGLTIDQEPFKNGIDMTLDSVWAKSVDEVFATPACIAYETDLCKIFTA